jgi:hypothetical protein
MVYNFRKIIGKGFANELNNKINFQTHINTGTLANLINAKCSKPIYNYYNQPDNILIPTRDVCRPKNDLIDDVKSIEYLKYAIKKWSLNKTNFVERMPYIIRGDNTFFYR